MTLRRSRLPAADRGYCEASGRCRETRIESLDRLSRAGQWPTNSEYWSAASGQYVYGGDRREGEDHPGDGINIPIPPLPEHRAIWFGRDYIGGWMAGLWVITLLAILLLSQMLR